MASITSPLHNLMRFAKAFKAAKQGMKPSQFTPRIPPTASYARLLGRLGPRITPKQARVRAGVLPQSVVERYGSLLGNKLR